MDVSDLDAGLVPRPLGHMVPNSELQRNPDNQEPWKSRKRERNYCDCLTS